jgi:Legume lectin domain.
VTVTVTNGVLYLSNAAGSSNNKINEIDATQLVSGVNIPKRFGSATGPMRNGGTRASGSSLARPNGETNHATSLSTANKVGVAQFATQFRFQLVNPNAAGIALVLQGGGLGNADASNSVAVRFDLLNNNGVKTNSTGLFVNGANANTPATDLTGAGIDLHSGHAFNVALAYDANMLNVTITDAATNASATQNYAIDLVGTLGGATATQNILSWTYPLTA